MKTIFFLSLLFIQFISLSQQPVQLTTQFCNSTLGGLGSNFYWTPNNTEQYRVKITLGSNTWIYAPGFTSTGYPKTFTNLVFAGVNPQYSTTYVVQVDYMVSGVWQNNWGPSCNLTTPPMTPSTIQLESLYCNSSQPFLTSIFRAQEVSGGTGWKFKVTNTLDGSQSILTKEASWGSTTTRRTTNINQVVTSGVGNLTSMPQVIYQIECAISIQNGPYTNWGAPCNITITQPISTTITTNDCGHSFNYTHQDSLNAVTPSLSTGCSYQFRLIDQSNSTVLLSSIVNVPRVLISQIPGSLYGKSYSASVKCIRQGIDGQFGPSCTITTPQQPVTKIQDGQFYTTDNCERTVPTFAQRVYAFAIPGCIDYQFEINTNGSQGILYKNTANIRHFRLSEVPGYIPEYNKIYDVRVRVNMNGIFGAWGESCWVRTPSSLPINVNEFETYDQQRLLIYPNPGDNQFRLHQTTDINNDLKINILDLNGKVIFSDLINHQQIKDYQFGENISTGIYQLIITDEINSFIESTRLIKN